MLDSMDAWITGLRRDQSHLGRYGGLVAGSDRVENNS